MTDSSRTDIYIYAVGHKGQQLQGYFPRGKIEKLMKHFVMCEKLHEMGWKEKKDVELTGKIQA